MFRPVSAGFSHVPSCPPDMALSCPVPSLHCVLERVCPVPAGPLGLCVLPQRVHAVREQGVRWPPRGLPLLVPAPWAPPLSLPGDPDFSVFCRSRGEEAVPWTPGRLRCPQPCCPGATPGLPRPQLAALVLVAGLVPAAPRFVPSHSFVLRSSVLENFKKSSPEFCVGCFHLCRVLASKSAAFCYSLSLSLETSCLVSRVRWFLISLNMFRVS